MTYTGKQFKDMIRGAGLRLEDVAKEAGVSASSASKWYNGDDIYFSTYNKLIAAYEKLKETHNGG